MRDGIGHGVHEVKEQIVQENHDYTSCDNVSDFVQVPSMERKAEREETEAFIRRTREARAARFDTQKPICLLLEVDQGTYKQYETRTPLPRRYIPKFCAACGVSIEWLLTGEGQAPGDVVVPPVRVVRRRRRSA
jgi:hypothetical protein